MSKKMTNDQKTMRKIARKIKTIMEKDLDSLEDKATKGWFSYILKDVYNFVNSASEGVTDAGVANLVELASQPPTALFDEKELGEEDS